MKDLDYFFYAKTIAVIGASQTAGKIGHVIMQNFLGGKFKGKVFPVNPNADEILGEKCYKSVKDIPGRVELVVICIPQKLVLKVFNECCEKKIKAAVIISAGFDEIGNKEDSKQLLVLAKKNKIRIIGPNCLGVLNCENGLDNLFLPSYRLERPGFGEVSFISQSGALGSAVLDWASSQEYGISKFISYGNALDVDETDLMQYLVEDKKTKVIVMYIEGVKNGRKFFNAAKKHGNTKPIIVLKGGITDEGSKAASSHTGSLAGSSKVFDAAIKQTGLIKASNLLELFDYARTLAKQPKPKGKKVQIITDGGGYGVLTADMVSIQGLKLAEMSKANKQKIIEAVPEHVIVSNPLDLTGDVNNERYKIAIEQSLEDKNIDMIIVILLYQVPTLDSKIIETIVELNNRKLKPMIAISVGGSYSEVHKRALEREGVVNFSYPLNAVKSLNALAEYYRVK